MFFATDLHGSEKCFQKFLRAADFYKADALVLGGDLTGKAMVPIVRHDDGSYRASFLNREEIASEGVELAALERNIRFNGQYIYHCDTTELAQLKSDETYQRRRFHEVIRKDLERWLDQADAKLAGGNIPCTAIPGNDDEEYVGEVISHSESIVNGEEGIIELGPLQVLSCGYSNPTPWNSPREVTEEELAAKLEGLASRLEANRPTIFNVHVPPHGTSLDLAPALDEDLKLRGGATSEMSAVGSAAVRDAILRYRPSVSLHGHVHESRASAKLGESVALNPGSEYNTGVLRGVIVRLDGQYGYQSHQFVAA